MEFILDNGYIYNSDELILYPESCTKCDIKHISDTRIPEIEYKNRKIGIKDVTSIGFYITRNCNLRCKYCMDSSTQGFEDLKLEEILYFCEEMILKFLSNRIQLDQCEDEFKITITGGGEPTYNWPLFFEVVSKLSELKKHNLPISLSLTTNGLITEPDKLNFIINNFDTIMVSYDGSVDVQNMNRPTATNVESAEIVIKTIQYFTKNNKSITIRSTILPEQLSHLKEIADDFYNRIGFDNISWNLNIAYPYGRGSKIRYCSDQNHTFFEYYLDLYNYLLDKYQYNRLSSNLISPRIVGRYCGSFGVIKPSVWLLPDRKIIACPEHHNGPVLGQMTEHGFSYNSDYTDVLYEITIANETSEKCRRCIAYRFCKGGCPAKSLSAGETKEYECQTTIKLWHHILNSLSLGKSAFGWTVKKAESNPDVFLMVECNDGES